MRFLFVLLLGLAGKIACSQQKIQLVDQSDNTVIIGAKATIISEETEFYFRSDTEGAFFINAPVKYPFDYEIYAVGFDTLVGTISETQKNKTSITLKLSPNRLFETVLVTAQYQPTLTTNSIQKSTVISSETIRQSGAVNLADILTYQTNIRLSQDNILGSSMSLGGLSGQNVKLLIDGVPVIGRQDGNIDLSQINLSNVERIEIIEGPLSVNYGTNALAGTINLITKKKQKKTVSVTVNPYYESIGNFNLTGDIGIRIKKQLFKISGGRNFFDGWSASDAFFELPKARLADTSRFKTWKPKEQWFFEGRYTLTFNSWSLSPFVRYFDEVILNRGLPLAPYQEFGLDDYYHTLRKDIGITTDFKFKKGKLKALISHNQFERNKNTYVKNLTDLSQTLSASSGAQDTSLFSLTNFRSNYIHNFNQKISLETGLDLTYETAQGKRIEGVNKTQGNYAVFVTTEWNPIKNLTLKPGVRYAVNTNYNAPLTPSVNLLYKIKNIRIRGAVARGFRAPTLKELYFDFVDINHNIQGNQDLNSEFSYNYSIGLGWRKLVNKKRLVTLDYNVFYNDIENLITLGGLPDGSFTYINIGTFKTLGNQLKFSFKSKRLTATVAGSYIGRYNVLSDELSAIDPFSFSPEASLNFSYALVKEWLKVNSFYKFNGPLQRYSFSDNEIQLNKQNSYSILDLSLSFALFKKHVLVTTGAKNILNVSTVQVLGTTGGVHSGSGNLNAARGTSVFVAVKYNFDYERKKEK